MLVSEVGIESAISYRKDATSGQEVVERIAARGQVHRKLMGLVCAGTQVPPPDAKLVVDGKEVGWITSAVWSPARTAVIALGYVRRECWDAGTEVRVTSAAGETLGARRGVAVLLEMLRKDYRGLRGLNGLRGKRDQEFIFLLSPRNLLNPRHPR